MAISVPPPSGVALGDVRSEVGSLRRVLVHRPGAELDRLTPDNAAELLFDDVLWPDLARAEHDELTATLRGEGVEVVGLEDLLADALKVPVAEAARLIAGDGQDLTPLPNMMFVRDTSAWLGSELVLGAIANPVRRREGELVARAYAGHPILAERSGRDGLAAGVPEVEGGDLFCLSERAVLVGVGSRSKVGAVGGSPKGSSRRASSGCWWSGSRRSARRSTSTA